MKTLSLTLAICACVASAFGQGTTGFEYVWTGGEAGYSGQIILDAASSTSGSLANVVSAQVTTPGGTFPFELANVFAFLTPFTWDATEIKSMGIFWTSSQNGPPIIVVKNILNLLNNMPGHVNDNELAGGSGTDYLDRTGSWLAPQRTCPNPVQF